MNRQDWEAQVFASNMNHTAKLVALVAGSFGNWSMDRTVWPGTSAISRMAGLTRDTTQEYIDAFVEQGWLKEVGKKSRASEYELCEPIAEPIGILARTKRKMNPASLAQLKVGKDQTIADSTGNTGDEPIADTTGPIADTTGGVLPIRQVPIADSIGTNIKEPKDRNLKEHKETTTVPDGPVGQEDPRVRQTDQPSLNTRTLEPSLTPEESPVRGIDKKVVLTNGEKREFESLMRAYKVSEEMAVESLEELQRSGWTIPFREAVLGTLQGLGAVSESAVVW